MESPDQPPVLQPETSTSPVTIDYKPRRLEMYQVSGLELDSLGSASSSLSLNSAFLGAGLTAAISFLTTLLTVPLRDRLNAIYVALLVVSAVATFYFGLRTWSDWRASQNRIQEIKQSAR